MQHILIVDDEVDAAYSLQQIFTMCGYRVSVANDGATALEINRADPVDGVVTDFRMPQMNGGTLILLLRKTRPDLPAIIVSGTVFDFSLDDSNTLSFTKPASGVGMVTAMRGLLAKRIPE